MDGIGKRLKELRKALGLSQREFGEKIGRTLRAIQNYEAEQRVPDETTLKLIEILFNVNPEWLRKGKGPMFRDETFTKLLKGGLAYEKGKRLRDLRYSLGLSKEEFSKALGIDTFTLEKYEKDRWPIPQELVLKLKEVYNANPEWIKEGVPPLFLKPEPTQARRVEAFGLKGATLDFLAEELAEKVVAEALFERGYTSTSSINLYSELVSLAKEKVKAHYQSLKAEIGFHLDTLERFLPPPKSSTVSEENSPESPKPSEDEGSSGENLLD